MVTYSILLGFLMSEIRYIQPQKNQEKKHDRKTKRILRYDLNIVRKFFHESFIQYDINVFDFSSCV